MGRKISTLKMLTLIFACGFGLLFSSAAYAEEINQGAIEMPDDSDVTTTEPVDQTDLNGDINPISEGQDEDPADNTDANAITGGKNVDSSDEENSINVDDNSTVFEAELAEETVEEPSIWPMVISLSALGAVIIVIIALNLLGRRRK